MTKFIELRGEEDLQRVFDAITKAAKSDKLGKVYSHGADQGRGTYEHWVQSDERQTSKHTLTGWRTDEMAVTEFEPKALKILAESFNLIAGGAPFSAFVEGTTELIKQLFEWVRWYPPVPAGSRYIRTRTLYRSWDKEVYL